MRALFNRLPLNRPLKQTWKLPAAWETRRDHHPTPATSELNFLPELPPAPRYPCPFLTATDMHTYVLPLYRFGWGISRVSSTSAAKPTPPATRLSKRIILSNPDIAKNLMKEITSTIIEPENHHPILQEQSQGVLSIVDIHVHTHTARAPPDGQCIDIQEIFIRKRPGITHRDIRFAILVERLLLDGGLVDLAPSVLYFYPQPTDIDSVHNFRALPPEVRNSAEE